MKVNAKASSQPFKTLFEFVQTDENLELAVIAIARNKKVITADDLHILDYSTLRLGRKNQVYGAVLAHLVQMGYLRKLGYVASSRTECHNRPVLQFEFVGDNAR